jgi:hypothetical protein
MKMKAARIIVLMSARLMLPPTAEAWNGTTWKRQAIP